MHVLDFVSVRCFFFCYCLHIMFGNTTVHFILNFNCHIHVFQNIAIQGPVVQSVSSLTKSLGEDSLSLAVLTK